MARHVDFFFFVGSLYTYIAVMRLESEAAKHGAVVRWRPFNLRAIMVEQNNVPARNPVKMAYIWRDIERRAQHYCLPFKPGVPYPVDPDLLANRVATLACEEGWGSRLVPSLYRHWFADHKPPHERENLEATLRALGQEPAAVLARADSAEARGALEANTAAARELGIFGAPTFVVGREIFWGGDRMEDAFAWA